MEIDIFSLTLPQQDIYFEQILYPESSIYNIGAKIEIEGQVDINIFKNAYIALIEQHDSYRIIIKSKENQPVVKILSDHRSELGFIDFSNESNSKEIALEYMESNFKKPFNLSREELLHKFILIKVSVTFYYLFSVYHHIITDGWGTSLMFQRLVRNYNELMEYGEIRSTYPYSYKAFINDDLAYQKSEDYQIDREFWKNKFSNLPDSFIPLIKKKKNISQRKELFFKRPLYNQLNQLSKELRVSTFHTILGILYVYFGRFHENEDLAIGLPVLNRGKSVFKKTVGLFMGVAPLRINIDFENSFEELVLQIKNQLRQDYRHQRFPLGKLIQELNLFQEKDRLFNVTLSFEKQNYSDHFEGTCTKVIPLSHNSERVALALYIREFDEKDDVKIDFDYNISYFSEDSVTRLVQTFEHITNQVLVNVRQSIKDIKLISNKGLNQILYDFNKTNISYSKNKTAIDVFKEQAILYSNNVAVSDGEIELSYKELDELSEQIALYIEEHISIGKPISVLLNRSSNLLAVLIGVMKSGHPYIPLDPNFPQERLNYIVMHSQSDCIISDEKLSNHFNFENASIINLESLINYQNTNYSLKYPEANDSAYIIYTSGSTGQPKGVEIGHLSLLNFLQSMKSRPGISNNDVLYAVTTYSFDISILELFLPLISGASIYIAKESVLSEPIKIIEELNSINPTIIQGTPSFYQMLFNVGWYGSKNLMILCGGDSINRPLAKKMILRSKEVWNMYGPTETTIWSSIKQILKPSDVQNIGKPIANTSFYILDKWLNAVPIGAIGNIYIGGSGLAKGYYLDEKLTSGKFVASPFKNYEKIYHTGDVGKWTKYGEIKFLGRNDNQVKLRGYRIELEEIEKNLIKIPLIQDAVVIVKKNNKDDILVAYVITDIDFNEKSIMKLLYGSLPDYMIPKVFISIETFPLTPNNKIDRKHLASKEIQFNHKKTINQPNGEIEKKMYVLWKEILQLDKLSTTDNFFILGGHSLKAVRLIHKANLEFSSNLNQKDIFVYPTIKLLSSQIENGKSKLTRIPKTKEKDYYNLTYSQKNIWLASQIKDASIAYNMDATYEIEGVINIDILSASILKILLKYEVLRTNFIEIDGIPKQVIKPETEVMFKLDEIYLKGNDIQDIIYSFNNKEYDLENDNLIRVQIIHKTENTFVLCFSTHHIIMDGWSIEIFIKELKGYYNSLLKQENKIEEKLELQFKDYSEWITSQNSNKEAQLFWGKKFMGYQPKFFFKKDYDENSISFNGKIHSFNFNKEVNSFVKEFAVENETTSFSVLTSLLSILIYKLYSLKDICIGTITSGRNIESLSNQIGMFVNTIPLRLYINGESTFSEILHETKREVNQSIQFDSFPIAEIIPNHSRLFNVLIVYQNPEFTISKFDDFKNLKIRNLKTEHSVSRLPVTFNMFHENGNLKCDLEYNSDMYSQGTIVYIVEKFKKLLHEMTSNSKKMVDDYDITLDLEKKIKQNIDINFNF